MRDAVDASIENMRDAVLAAILGCLTVLQNLLQRGHLDKTQVCQWAAWGGHLQVLQWARENGCPWDKRRARTRRGAATSRCCSGRERTAARGTSGRARTRRIRPPRGAAVGARERLPVGQEDVRGRGGVRPLRDVEVGARERLPVGRGDVRERGVWRSPRGAEVGARERLPVGRADVRGRGAQGHLEVLQWARENGCPWDKRTCTNAAWRGNLEVLQWARENGCPWDERTCANAAWRGHLEVLQWLRENDCPWDEDTCRCGAGRPPRGAEMGARERLPVEYSGCARARDKGPPPRDGGVVAFDGFGGSARLETLFCNLMTSRPDVLDVSNPPCYAPEHVPETAVELAEQPRVQHPVVRAESLNRACSRASTSITAASAPDCEPSNAASDSSGVSSTMVYVMRNSFAATLAGVSDDGAPSTAEMAEDISRSSPSLSTHRSITRAPDTARDNDRNASASAAGAAEDTATSAPPRRESPPSRPACPRPRVESATRRRGRRPGPRGAGSTSSSSAPCSARNFLIFARGPRAREGEEPALRGDSLLARARHRRRRRLARAAEQPRLNAPPESAASRCGTPDRVPAVGELEPVRGEGDVVRVAAPSLSTAGRLAVRPSSAFVLAGAENLDDVGVFQRAVETARRAVH